ncbi:RDD family protein [Novosphingobium sp. KCTC 2891]|uniref:RDD family protein n=1 Tax=Novosphingobium sp. KCTC 2891 TaxID=2989730 RepID=UPI0022228096|nr:RDD family protein [Novosphingobium sp. KCTC 2891]MCW1383340.1 RDD family protein [Novosphingobium sp. KCTC 2891]
MTARVVLEAERRRRWLTTPEGVALPFTLATRGSRAGALLIDLFLIGTGMVLTTLALLWLAQRIGLNLTNKGPAGHAVQALAIAWFTAMFLLRNAWFLAFELGPRGATPGKRVTGIRIAARGGGPLTTEAVIARNLMRDIELFMPLVFIGSALSTGSDTGPAAWAGLGWFAVFIAFPFLNRDGLRCGDVIAGTWVIEAPKRRLEQALSLGEGGAGRSAATGAQYRFSDADLAVYGEYELKALERVLRDNRPETLVEVAQTICGKIGWSAGTGDERAFLDAYYTQLRARLERGMRFGRRKADKHA